LSQGRSQGLAGLEEGLGCLGGDLAVVPAEFPGLEVVDDGAEPADFGVYEVGECQQVEGVPVNGLVAELPEPDEIRVHGDAFVI